MPKFLVNELVNREAPNLESVKKAREVFDVSLTSMLVRTVQVSDFPCAMCSVREGRIEWGFTSSAFKRAGAYKVNRGQKVSSRGACKFIGEDLSRYREGYGWGEADAWLEWENGRLDVAEHYVAIPSVNQVLIFITAQEDEVFTDD